MSALFDNYDPERSPWARNPRAQWHILGERFPRIAPTDWPYVSPCTKIVYSDGMETAPRRSWLVQGERTCAWCQEFHDQRVRSRRYSLAAKT